MCFFFCNLTLHIFKKRPLPVVFYHRLIFLEYGKPPRVLHSSAHSVSRLPSGVRSGLLIPSRTRAGAHSHHKVCRWRCAHILDSVFVIGVHETHRARPETVARTADRQLDRSLSNQPHFRVHMMVCRVGRTARRQSRFMHLQRLAGGELALQNVADLCVVRRSNRQLFERIHCRWHGSLLRGHAVGPHNGGKKSCRKQETHITSRDGHLLLLLQFANALFSEFEQMLPRSCSTSRQRIFSMPSFVKRPVLRRTSRTAPG